MQNCKKYNNFDIRNQVKEISLIILMLKFWKSTWVALKLKHPKNLQKYVYDMCVCLKPIFYTKTRMVPAEHIVILHFQEVILKVQKKLIWKEPI